MKFSIITPSFRNSKWLKLCIASVADQGVEVEHIVQDAVSDDGTLDWLPQDKRVKAFIEKDAGMYDGVNRGLRRATGEILAYLNCDEQYLSGALQAVENFFKMNPTVDIVYADVVIVDAKGNYKCSRQMQLPLKYHTTVVHLNTYTCATFFRRKLLEQDQLFFDASLKYLGDGDWVLRAIEKKISMSVLRYYTSAFAETGENISLHPKFNQEKIAFSKRAPWANRLRGLLIVHHRLRRFLGGLYFPKPFTYSIYTPNSPSQRVTYNVTKPAFGWKPWSGGNPPASPA